MALAETYAKKFYDSYTEELYDFLFTHNYPAWFCNLIEKTSSYGDSASSATRTLKEFVMKLHTGESLVAGTPQWTWKQREELGQQYLTDLASDILNKWHTEWKNLEKYVKPNMDGEIDKLQKSLELDGYTYKDLRLLVPESDVLDLQEEAGVLDGLFTLLNLSNKQTVFHHLKLSEEHYINSKWDDSISNSRKFLEGVLQEVAAKHSVIVKKINLEDSVYSNPVRLLRHLSLTFAQFVMLRLQGNFVKNYPSQQTIE